MHDLWIFPAPRSSRWFARMDWYLDWQMSRGLAYGGLHLPEGTFAVAEENGLPLEVERPENPALLVLPAARVPAKTCLVLDDADRPLAEWLKDCAARVAGLHPKTARVFLPAGRSIAEAAAAWAEVGAPFAAEFDADLEVKS